MESTQQPQVSKETHEQPHQTKNGGAKKEVIVMFSIGLPGMGKTTYLKQFRKFLEERGCALSIISSDQVRTEIMEEEKQKNPNITHQEAFNLSTREAKTRFDEYVKQAILSTKDKTEDRHVVFLDKNHPPNLIDNSIRLAKNPKFTSQFNMKAVVIKPLCAGTFKTEESHYPFSLTFFLKCMERAVARQGHETLVGERSNVAGVVIGFFNFYKDFVADKEVFLGKGADAVVEVPFTDESAEIEEEVNEKVGKEFGKVLHGLKGFEVNQEKLSLFFEVLDKSGLELKNPPVDFVASKTLEVIKQISQLFESSASL